MVRTAILAAAAWLATVSIGAACSIDYPRTIGGAPLAVIANVQGSAPCIIPVRTGRGTVRAVLVSRPSNGTVGVGTAGVTYRARSGWRGTDGFTFRRVVTENGAVIAQETVNVRLVVR